MPWLELILCGERENEQKRVLTECHAENDIIFSEQTERRCNWLELILESVERSKNTDDRIHTAPTQTGLPFKSTISKSLLDVSRG